MERVFILASVTECDHPWEGGHPARRFSCSFFERLDDVGPNGGARCPPFQGANGGRGAPAYASLAPSARIESVIGRLPRPTSTTSPIEEAAVGLVRHERRFPNQYCADEVRHGRQSPP